MASNSSCCSCDHFPQNDTAQTLQELSFSRGIWSSAVDGDLQKVKSFIKQSSASADERDSSGYTALHYAARNGHTDVCRELLIAGVSVNVQTTSGGVTPLHRACYKGHNNIVQLLLSNGGDPQLVDNDGMTALHKACEGGHIDTIKLLHSVLTNPSTSIRLLNKQGSTPFELLNKQSKITDNEKDDIKLLFN